MIWDRNQNRRVILNGLFLDKIGKQSGTYFMTITVIQELLLQDPNYLLITTEDFSWASNQSIKVRHFNKRFRFVVESFYRNRFRDEIWVNFDYFLPFLIAGSNRIDLAVIHDVLPLDIPDAVSWQKRIWFRIQVQRSLKLSKVVITISNFCKSQISLHYPQFAEKIRVISNPVNIDRFGIQPGGVVHNSFEKYFVTVAAPWPHKNLLTVVSAFETFYQKIQIPLFVIGSRFNHLSRYSDSNAVKYLGFLSDEDLGKVILDSQAVVAPSLYEGFGMTIYEGLGLGKFVLASNLIVYPDLPNLIRVDAPHSYQSWVQALEIFVQDPPIHKNVSLEDFHPTVVASKYNKLIREINAKFT